MYYTVSLFFSTAVHASQPVVYLKVKIIWAKLGGSHVTKAWHILRLWMWGRSPAMEGSYEYIE
jgi:hypothetical protein